MSSWICCRANMWGEVRFEMHFALLYVVFFLFFVAFLSDDRYWTWFHNTLVWISRFTLGLLLPLHTRSVVTGLLPLSRSTLSSRVSLSVINLLTVWAREREKWQGMKLFWAQFSFEAVLKCYRWFWLKIFLCYSWKVKICSGPLFTD